MRYSFNGKKRKPLPRKSRKAARSSQTKAKIPLHARLRMEEMNAHTEKYPSWNGDKLSPCVLEDGSTCRRFGTYRKIVLDMATVF